MTKNHFQPFIVLIKIIFFLFVNTLLGLIPAVISPFVMEKIGKSNCSRYFLTGERFSSEVAKSINLINDHFKDENELDENIDKILDEICNNSPAAVRNCKKLIENVNSLFIMDRATKLYVSEQIARARISKEGQEGLSAFFQKRKPSWTLK